MTPEFETQLPADLAAELELARPIVDVALDAAAVGLSDRVSQRILGNGRRVYSGTCLPRWTSLYHLAWVIPTFSILIALQTFGGLTITPSVRAKSADKVYTTHSGQRASITLADGSVMLLAPASSAKVSGRKINLVGEALFTVTSKSDVPFVVVSSGVTTRVLGTSFSVRNYKSDGSVRIVVAEGRVSVKSNGEAVLTVGDAAEVNQQGEIFLDREVNIATALAWTTGRLTFDEVPFREVAPNLERWYGVQIHVMDERLLNRRITTSLQRENTSQAMKLIAELLNARVEQHGATIRFVPLTSKNPENI